VSGRSFLVIPHVGTRVENPDVFVGLPFWRKMTFAFTPWLYGVNVRAAGAGRCEVAVLHENLEHLAGCLERQLSAHQRGASAGLEDGEDMLDEVECLLLVSMVKSSRSGAWFAPFVPKAIGEDAIETVAAIRFVNVSPSAMCGSTPCRNSSQREPARARHESWPW